MEMEMTASAPASTARAHAHATLADLAGNQTAACKVDWKRDFAGRRVVHE